MSFLGSTSKKITEIYDKFIEVRVKIEYLEIRSKENYDEFKEILSQVENRISKLEKETTLDKAELLSEIRNIKTLYESVYKESIRDSVKDFASKLEKGKNYLDTPKKD